MPTDAKVGNPRANGKPGKKQGLMGIPTWGWIVGIALGLVVGYLVIRKSGSSSTSTTGSSSGSDSSPLGNSESGTGGGAVAGSPTPNNPVIVGAGGTQGSTSDPGAVTPSGDSSTSQTVPSQTVPSIAPTIYQNVPDPYTAPYQPIPGTSTHPGAVNAPPILNIPYGSNIHQPGVQIG